MNEKLKALARAWGGVSLVLRILCGFVLGVILGFLCPSAPVIPLLGEVFVGALKGVAPILVFVLVISSLANAGGNIGRRFRTVIVLYMISTFLAAAVAVFMCFAFPLTISLKVGADTAAPQGISEVLVTLLRNMVSNPIGSIVNANYIGILSWAAIFGLALKEIASDATRTVLQNISDAVSAAVRIVISLAPFGIMGLVFSSVSSGGYAIFKDYGALLLLLVGCMLTVFLIVDPLIVAITLKRNPYPLVWRCFRESGITAFFTRSSAANIPVNMALCEKMELDRDMYSVSIPLGATINMDGAAVTITVMTMVAAHTVGVKVDIPTAIILSVLSTFAACGASGVAGGSLLLIPMACSLFGIGSDVAMQMVAVGFVIGIVQDSVETAINSASDVMFTATAEYYERMKNTD